MGLGQFRPEGDRTLEVRKRRRQIALLAEHEPKQVVRVDVAVVLAQHLGQLFTRRIPFAASGGLVTFCPGTNRSSGANT